MNVTYDKNVLRVENCSQLEKHMKSFISNTGVLNTLNMTNFTAGIYLIWEGTCGSCRN